MYVSLVQLINENGAYWVNVGGELKAVDTTRGVLVVEKKGDFVDVSGGEDEVRIVGVEVNPPEPPPEV